MADGGPPSPQPPPVMPSGPPVQMPLPPTQLIGPHAQPILTRPIQPAHIPH